MVAKADEVERRWDEDQCSSKVSFSDERSEDRGSEVLEAGVGVFLWGGGIIAEECLTYVWWEAGWEFEHGAFMEWSIFDFPSNVEHVSRGEGVDFRGDEVGEKDSLTEMASVFVEVPCSDS